MNRSKHTMILRTVWTAKGVAEFEHDINKMMHEGWEPHGIEIHKGFFRYLCMAMMGRPPAKCECDCPCCIEIHQGTCECDCDCCLAHAHRDGRYHKDEDDD